MNFDEIYDYIEDFYEGDYSSLTEDDFNIDPEDDDDFVEL